MHWKKSDMFFFLQNIAQISDSFQNKKRVSIFEITFDMNKIETCGFHYLKEEINLHRILYFRYFYPTFSRVLSQILLKSWLLSYFLIKNRLCPLEMLTFQKKTWFKTLKNVGWKYLKYKIRCRLLSSFK